ncbi:2,5-diketo-D-gluconic acid reductase B [Aquisphaera giovannonii]|uniref:2,5-diketo-D-gluconic acid reductase B n=1 Tax=Aquisphaera giovannonii TaxID=406548 RepID=A0A5B9VYA3_9BACT|nr:aldo/keto reductase [Aquisphaera giovannonii]QEH33356.1 2,5-diketo-D-gluconic acid reductase B [Aquisphaera giovannonii]
MEPVASGVSRRDFVRSGSAVLGGLALSASPGAKSGAEEPSPGATPMPQVVLGRTGAKVSRLGIGCAYFQRDRVTPDDVTRTLHRALELRVNYLDTAPVYGNDEKSSAEVKMGPGLRELRDRFFLVTKTEEPTYEGTLKLLRQSLKRMRTDRIDLVHLHNFGDAKLWGDRKLVFGDRGAMAALREAKKQGVVRFVGASGHLHPTRFHEAIDSGEVDVLMNAVNFVVRHTYDFEHKVWARAQSLNLGLVAMKVLGGAARPEAGFKMEPAHYEKAIRYALSIPGLSVAVIGLENIPELEKAASVVAHAKPLSPEEDLELARTGLELASRPEWKEAYGLPLA